MPALRSPEVPLKVLICDSEATSAEALERGLSASKDVIESFFVTSIVDARHVVGHKDLNTIFIDPMSLGLEEASTFIFETRTALPEIVFVLFMDKARAERRRGEFYRGERWRFAHYYSLDKQTPVAAFADELDASIWQCQSDLVWRLSSSSLQRLRAEAGRLATSAGAQGKALLDAVRDSVNRSQSRLIDVANPRSVFLSYRFAEEEYVAGLAELLRQNNFEVVTGQSSNTYISRSIIDRIRESAFFLSLITRADAKADGTFTTSPWLLEEKGVALAFGKPLVLMIEEGVSDFGGLQGDWQRIHFGPKGFLTAALEAVAQLKSYVGAG